jgi:SAM-dependent methyltransferase
MEEWFRNWFGSKEYLEVYRHRDDEDAQKILDLIFNKTNLPNKPLILDAACGAGRHLINLTLEGYNPVGFDLSMTLLKKAKEEAAAKSILINVFRADIRNVFLKANFDLVINLFTSFGYFLTDEENFRFCTSAYNMLKSKGFYVLDYLNIDFLVENLQEESVRVIGEKKIYEFRRIENDRVVKEIIIESENEKRKYFESVKLYSKDSLVDKLLKIGFELDSIFGDYDGVEFDRKKSPRLILFMKK